MELILLIESFHTQLRRVTINIYVGTNMRVIYYTSFCVHIMQVRVNIFFFFLYNYISTSLTI